jgi:hypothetical protein
LPLVVTAMIAARRQARHYLERSSPLVMAMVAQRKALRQLQHRLLVTAMIAARRQARH